MSTERSHGDPHAEPTEAAAPQGAASELAYLAKFERLIIDLSARFMNLTAYNIDREITDALEAIGNFAQVDRSYVFQFSSDGKTVSNTHEWCAGGIEPAIDKIQNAPVERFAWSMARFKRGELFHVPNVSRLPQEAQREKLEFQSQGIRSMINVPLTCAGKVLGFVGFDSVRAPKNWCEEHINLLIVVGQIIAAAIERERATAALTRQVKMEKLLASISTRFINISTSQLDAAIGKAIAEIGTFTGVDRSYVFQFSADGRSMRNSHEWCAEGIEPHIDRLQGWSVAPFGYSMARMKRGEVFHVRKVADLPAEAAAEKVEFAREGIKTLINVPIVVKDTMIGFLGFDAVRTHTSWSDDDIRLLRLIGEIIANALERKSTEERLQVSLQEKEVLLREIHHRVKNNLQIVHSLLYLQANALRDQLDPIAVEAFRQSQSRIKSMATIHERLYRSDDVSAIDCAEYLHALIPDLLRLYDTGERIRMEVKGHVRPLTIDMAIPCGLIVNELIANCLKHAFPAGRRGRIEVRMEEREDRRMRLTVADDGVGFASEKDWPGEKTLGMQLVGDLTAQLGGHLAIVTGSAGSRFSLTFEAR